MMTEQPQLSRCFHMLALLAPIFVNEIGFQMRAPRLSNTSVTEYRNMQAK